MSEFMQGFMVGAMVSSFVLMILSAIISSLKDTERLRGMAAFSKRLDEIGKD